AGNFTRAGIMVHAYLMYGFPTQTAQETVDSLEVVRQLFMNGVVQSGFWHQFAMTAHSPVGMDPQRFGIEKENTPPGAFANNDLVAIDRQGCDHETFSEGLKKSLYNYMHGICFDFPLQEWFDFRIPRATIAKDFIRNIISSGPLTTHDSPLTTHHFPRTTHPSPNPPDPNSKILWPGILPSFIFYTRQKKGKSTPAAKIIIQTIQQEVTILADERTGKWLEETFPLLVIGNHDVMTFQRLAELYTTSVGKNFMIFRDGSVMKQLRENGLVIV
ncbi:MAG: radical SAM protein, partial [bacterium]